MHIRVLPARKVHHIKIDTHERCECIRGAAKLELEFKHANIMILNRSQVLRLLVGTDACFRSSVCILSDTNGHIYSDGHIAITKALFSFLFVSDFMERIDTNSLY